MSLTGPERVTLAYKVKCNDGSRYVVYNAALIGNPSDHVPNKWYVRPYPVPVPLGAEVGEPFETAEQAEQAARSRHRVPMTTGQETTNLV
jgi:hypothetical protein